MSDRNWRTATFIPYKASMWDSMASVWQAFQELPGWTTEVVVAPYYELKDGRAVQRVHEATKFPPDVELIEPESWLARPDNSDVIFVHNPYDDMNTVTQLQSEFFVRNLSQRKGMLVYLPYFVTAGPLGPFHSDAEVFEHFDLIVAPSEHAKSYYAARWQPRVEALGSPKVDAAVKASSQSQRRDAAHLQLLLNLSIGGLLRWGKALIAQQADVMSRVSERSNMQLRWRPHPLLLASITSMRPELRAEYEALELHAKALGCVVDHSPDVQEACGKSSAYIGEDASSIIHLIGSVGKPVALLPSLHPMEAPCHIELPDPSYPLMGPWCVDGGYAWFWHGRLDCLCRVDLTSHICEMVSPAAGNRWAFNGHGRVIKYDDVILATPLRNSSGAVWNQAQGLMSSWPAKDHHQLAYNGGIKWRDFAVLIPNQALGVEVVEPETGSVVKSIALPRVQHEDRPVTSLEASMIVGDHLVIGLTAEGIILIVDLHTESVQEVTAPYVVGGFSASACHCDHMWLSTTDGRYLVQYDPATTKSRRVPVPIELVPKTPFHHLSSIGNHLILTDLGAGTAVAVNTDSLRFQAVPLTLSPSDGDDTQYAPQRWLPLATTHDAFFVQDTRSLSVHSLGSDLTWKSWKPEFDSESARRLEELQKLRVTMDSEGLPAAWRLRDTSSDLDSFLDYLESSTHDFKLQRSTYELYIGRTDAKSGWHIANHVATKLAIDSPRSTV